MIKTLQQLDWDIIKQAALTTKGLKQKSAVTSEWKTKALRSEHSMLYFSDLILEVEMQYKTAIHLKTHNKTAGFYMLVQSQRPDWTDKPRDAEAVVKTIIKANPKALIEISRVRLCLKSAEHTVATWNEILDYIALTEPEIRYACIPNCEYRGFCTEFESCGWYNGN